MIIAGGKVIRCQLRPSIMPEPRGGLEFPAIVLESQNIFVGINIRRARSACFRTVEGPVGPAIGGALNENRAAGLAGPEHPQNIQLYPDFFALPRGAKPLFSE